MRVPQFLLRATWTGVSCVAMDAKKSPVGFVLFVTACCISFGGVSARAQETAPTLSALQEEVRDHGLRISHKVAISLYSGFITTQALDVHSTLRAIDAGSREANAAMRWVTGSPARFIVVKAATTVGTTLILERLRRTHPKPALFLLVGLNSASAVIVAHNYRAGAR